MNIWRSRRLLKLYCAICCAIVLSLTVFHRSYNVSPEPTGAPVRLDRAPRVQNRGISQFRDYALKQVVGRRSKSLGVMVSGRDRGGKGVAKQWDVLTNNCHPNHNITRANWFNDLDAKFKEYVLYRHCRYFPMILNHPKKCVGDVYLLIVVKSIITQYHRREVIRQTWGKEMEIDGKRIKTLFLLGTSSNVNERSHYQKLLEYEDRLYGDILQWDFTDSFFNLTLKEVNFLKWFSTYCHRVQHIFKGDDDVFVSTENILEYLKGPGIPNLFVGDTLHKARPIRKKDNKYYVPLALYNKTFYPSYVGGAGFVTNQALARKLYQASETLELYPIDDVFLGMCLEVLGVSPISHSGFKTFGIVRNKNSKMNSDPCLYKHMLVVHKLLTAELLEMWAAIHSNLTCSLKLPRTFI
ncbi:UDP-GlcNAc:betaGal beta-1,3-N-acetylglucosaminyltransferase 7 [Callorhinchus milii]|uniref:Hexosyltransferase n=1 Tax=Callorhinchus milii TaxID=7868 RepID=A0A4W3HZP6_CALMI|nr:UDP-GlcNAc:betaGal beta-1,3-N-acetylglucosaminyltransferase 7 [Callorhinchus milii]XP_007900576.1 UDP-GlcNAc:betaGal beta-1,3-N-acetylglucosaminyltransferase 7 [Callorhinchus milii]|eukprot:gi/632968528/ref/XP_007900575.1/ PREDICTED: UDP-GlcNAc:betaGal beta-1,3-N-acetylglucosaminyltransferase 7 [Callorhinchus milii]